MGVWDDEWQVRRDGWQTGNAGGVGMTKRPAKYVWEGVIDPAMGRNIGWRDLMKNDLEDATILEAFMEGLYRKTFDSTPNLMQKEWQEHIKRLYQDTVDEQYCVMAKKWDAAWKSYEIPQPLVSDLQFPKWRDETMNEDRKFAYECAKHALRQLQADYDRASAEAESKEELVRKGSISLKELEAAYAAALHKKTVCDAFLLKAKGTVAALEPKP